MTDPLTPATEPAALQAGADPSAPGDTGVRTLPAPPEGPAPDAAKSREEALQALRQRAGDLLAALEHLGLSGNALRAADDGLRAALEMDTPAPAPAEVPAEPAATHPENIVWDAVTAGAAPLHYTVLHGESAPRIAEKLFGRGMEWPALVLANREVLAPGIEDDRVALAAGAEKCLPGVVLPYKPAGW